MASMVDSAVLLDRYRNVCVIGAGVIGASWTALFLAHGLNVVVNDPQPDIETMVKAALSKIAPSLQPIWYRRMAPSAPNGNSSFGHA
jgi:ketoreductase RED1